MKKAYETPSADKMLFNYRDQVVAASGVYPSTCTQYYTETGGPQKCWHVEDHSKPWSRVRG